MQIDKSREPFLIDPIALSDWVKSRVDEGARTSGKLSQNKLAQILGCTAATISRWKSGKAGDSLYRETLEAIARFEEVTFEQGLEMLAPSSLPNCPEIDLDSEGELEGIDGLKLVVDRLLDDNESLKESNELLQFEIKELNEFVKVLAKEFHESRNAWLRKDQI